MQLNVCPGCDGFVRSEWVHCATCGHGLGPDGQPSTPAVENISQAPHVDALDAPGAYESSAAAPAGRHFAKEVTTLEDSQSSPPSNEVRAVHESSNPPPSSNRPIFVKGPIRSGNPSAPARPESPSPAGPSTSAPGSERPRYIAGSSPSTGFKSLGHSRAVRLIGGAFALVVLVVMCAVLVATIGDIGVSSADSKKPPKPEATSPAAFESNWVFYQDPAGRFSLELPTPPAVTGSPDQLKIQSNSPESNSTVNVRVTKTNPSNGGSGNDAGLKQALASDATRTGTIIRSQQISTSSGRRQLDAYMTSGDKKTIVNARYFYSGNYFYGVYVVTTSPTGDPATFSQVTDSLKTNP